MNARKRDSAQGEVYRQDARAEATLTFNEDNAIDRVTLTSNFIY